MYITWCTDREGAIILLLDPVLQVSDFARYEVAEVLTMFARFDVVTNLV